MTLVLAFKWRVGAGDAVLISSDSRATTPLGIAYEVRKVKPMVFEDRPLAVAGGAGDAVLVKWGYEVAEEVLAGEAGERGAPLPAPLFRRAVRMIEDRLAGRLYRLRGLGIEPSFQMVLGSVDGEGRASLYVFDNRGLAEPVHENPGYAVIGSGFITGGLLLLRLLGFSELAASGRTGLLDLGMLTAFIIDVVSEVDTSVGPFVGESWLMRLEERGARRWWF
ncbi:MAG: hypothetical protein DRK00_07050 [Thermoprotei archaeon]|nr:MAG: hypothetical protein DRK00_07050 [Thermoprotei archaeon]